MARISLPTVLILQIAPLGVAAVGMMALELELTRSHDLDQHPCQLFSAKKPDILPHALTVLLCDPCSDMRKSNQKPPVLHINHWGVYWCLFWMDYWYLLLNLSLFCKPFELLMLHQTRPEWLLWEKHRWCEKTCASSNFLSHMYNMWEMSHSLNVCKKACVVSAFVHCVSSSMLF